MICKTNSVISARGLGILKDEGILFNLCKQHGDPHFPQQNNKKRKKSTKLDFQLPLKFNLVQSGGTLYYYNLKLWPFYFLRSNNTR